MPTCYKRSKLDPYTTSIETHGDHRILKFGLWEIPSPDPDRYEGPIPVGGPFWVSERDMINRIKKGTEEKYWEVLKIRGYRPDPLFTVAGLSQLDKAAARRLRESSMSLSNPFGAGFTAFKLQMFCCLPFDESGLSYWASICPSDIRILQDVTSAGTVPFLRHYCEAIGEPPAVPLDSWALFHPYADSWEESVPVFEDYHLCLLNTKLIAEGFYRTYGQVFQFKWQGAELESVEAFCLRFFRVPRLTEVSRIYPFDAYLFGILRIDVRLLARRVTEHWWIRRNFRTSEDLDRIHRHERRRILREGKAERRLQRRARRKARHENRSRLAQETREFHRQGCLVDAPADEEADNADAADDAGTATNELADFLEKDYVITTAPFGDNGSLAMPLNQDLGASGER